MTGIMKDAYVTIEVSDIGRAIRFYTGVLGLKRAKKWGDYWAELQAPGMFIALHATDERHPKKVGSGNVSLGFDVGDLDGAPKSLEKKKVKARTKNRHTNHADFFMWFHLHRKGFGLLVN